MYDIIYYFAGSKIITQVTNTTLNELKKNPYVKIIYIKQINDF
jgi:hypothetical protein